MDVVMRMDQSWVCRECGTPVAPDGRCANGHLQGAPPAPAGYGAVPPQYQQHYPVPTYLAGPARNDADGWAIAGFVVTLVLGAFGCCLFPAWGLSGLLGVVFGFLGRTSVDYRWMSTMAMILGGLELLAFVALIALIAMEISLPFIEAFQSVDPGMYEYSH